MNPDTFEKNYWVCFTEEIIWFVIEVGWIIILTIHTKQLSTKTMMFLILFQQRA